MTPQEFVAKWGPGGTAYHLNERAGAQPHFMDLCQLLSVATPGDADNYTFERGVTKTGSGHGFADVWKRGHFGRESKAPGKSLEGALKQLMMYALPLENPPLLVVSDRLRIEIHTHFTGTPSERHVVMLEELTRPDVREKLRWVFTAPERFKPAKTNQQITEEAASAFAGTAERLRRAGVPPEQVSHFLTQCLFCFFAEDVGLLPARLFERLVGVQIAPDRLRQQLAKLFESMRDGGLFGVDDIPWFNGGLFATIEVPALDADDVRALRAASGLNWSAIDPSIFGTLFERGLDPTKRSQLGAHYTDPDTIMRIVGPVVEAPLVAEWNRVAALIEAQLLKRDALREAAAAIPAKTKADKDKFARLRTQANDADRTAQRAFNEYLEKLKEYKVLDPACGSGNFLYLALKVLKDIEHKVNLDAEALGLQRQHDVTGPHNVLGLEVNEYAAELARVTVWIGELQWRIQHGYAFKTNPVLEPLDCIEHRDALMDAEGTEAAWPPATVVIGNPPFVGDKKMRAELGDAYTESLRRLYKGRVPGGADLVCYWFEKARALIEQGLIGAAGFVATQAIRSGFNVRVLQKVVQTTTIFNAWSDEEWINDGAAVRVSLICFGSAGVQPTLNSHPVEMISADLAEGATTGGGVAPLTEPDNADTAFRGITRNGAFDVDGVTARQWLQSPNPAARSNVDVVRPLLNGMDITDRPSDRWVVDFGCEMSEQVAALYELPFEYVVKHVRPERAANRREVYRNYWWRFAEPRPAMRSALRGLKRYIATPMVAKHRLFVAIPATSLPEQRLIAIALEDDASFGILSSSIHSAWALRWGGVHGDGAEGGRPVYNVAACFETFPFPNGCSPKHLKGAPLIQLPNGALAPQLDDAETSRQLCLIADAAYELDAMRNRWLNPPEWVDTIDDVVPAGMTTSPYPARLVPKQGCEDRLRRRTLTDLYNERPQWLMHAHARLDRCVAQAYGWDDYTADLPQEEILRRLIQINQARHDATSLPS